MVVYINGLDYEFYGKVRGSNNNKFNRVAKLATMFDSLDAKFSRFIERGIDTIHAECALAMRLMLQTGIRIGNESSAEGYMTKPHPNSKVKPKFVQTYGLTTLKPEHLEFVDGKAYLSFTGKRQVQNTFEITDSDLVSQLFDLQCRKQNSETLFEMTVYELTKFVKTYVGKQFTPKDFRTLRANILAYDAWCELPDELPKFKKDLNAEIKSVCQFVADGLNNTVGVCKRSYIDPTLLEQLIEQRFNNQ